MCYLYDEPKILIKQRHNTNDKGIICEVHIDYFNQHYHRFKISPLHGITSTDFINYINSCIIARTQPRGTQQVVINVVEDETSLYNCIYEILKMSEEDNHQTMMDATLSHIGSIDKQINERINP